MVDAPLRVHPPRSSSRHAKSSHAVDAHAWPKDIPAAPNDRFQSLKHCSSRRVYMPGVSTVSGHTTRRLLSVSRRPCSSLISSHADHMSLSKVSKRPLGALAIRQQRSRAPPATKARTATQGVRSHGDYSCSWLAPTKPPRHEKHMHPPTNRSVPGVP